MSDVLVNLTIQLEGEAKHKNKMEDKTSNGISSHQRWIKLNVGGQVFLTTKTTLMKEPESFLSRLILDDPDLKTDKDGCGAYMIDRDPKYFSPILNYLRHGKMIIDDGISVEGVLEEAEFYSIKSLVTQLKDQIKVSRDSAKHAYRVLSCHEDELARIISNMSDGWRFEQLLNIGTNYNYGPDEHGEYLCIVSKDLGEFQSASAEELNPNNVNTKVLQMRGT